MILAARTDQPQAELHLLSNTGKVHASYTWEAHRELAATLLTTIHRFLSQQGIQAKGLEGLIIFTGSGSFTGLRIGATVLNALAYSHSLPITAGEGENWLEDGVLKLRTAAPGTYVIPKYDREPNITKPKS